MQKLLIATVLMVYVSGLYTMDKGDKAVIEIQFTESAHNQDTSKK